MVTTQQKDSPLELARQFVKSENFKGLGTRLYEARKKGKPFFFTDAMEEFGFNSYAAFMEIGGEELKVDFSQSIQSLVQTLDNTYSWLVPEVILDIVKRGVRRGAHWQDWVGATVQVGQPDVKIPVFDKPSFQAERIGETKTIPTVTLSFDERLGYIWKYGLGFRMSYEANEFTRLDYLSAWIEEFGQGLADGLNAYFLTTLLTGNTDRAGAVITGTAPATVGIITAGHVADMVYNDFVEVQTMMSACNFNPTTIIANRAAINTILNITEFKTRVLGVPAVSVNLQGMTIPTGYTFYQDESVPTDQLIFLDPARTMVEAIARELLFEDEKFKVTQEIGEYATYIKGGVIRQRGGRVIVDCTADIAGAGAWPAWYGPTSTTL